MKSAKIGFAEDRACEGEKCAWYDGKQYGILTIAQVIGTPNGPRL